MSSLAKIFFASLFAGNAALAFHGGPAAAFNAFAAAFMLFCCLMERRA